MNQDVRFSKERLVLALKEASSDPEDLYKACSEALRGDPRDILESGGTPGRFLHHIYEKRFQRAARGEMRILGGNGLLERLLHEPDDIFRVFGIDGEGVHFTLFTDETVAKVVGCLAVEKIPGSTGHSEVSSDG